MVWQDGSAADVRLLLAKMNKQQKYKFKTRIESDFRALLSPRDRTQLAGLVSDDFEFALEVGWGTVEIITGPNQTLHELKAIHEEAMECLLDAAQPLGMIPLGLGIQPRSPPSQALMTPRARYGAMEGALSDAWFHFTTTASDQLHVDVSKPEAISVVNLANLMTPLIIGLCANSTVTGGEVSEHCCRREGMMNRIQSSHHRHGLPKRPFTSFNDMVSTMCDMPYLMRKDEGEWHSLPQDLTFRGFLDAQLTMEEQPTIWEEFQIHDHYIWNSARLRAKQGTVELRAACQQPWDEHMAAATLQLAVVEAHHEIRELVMSTFAGATEEEKWGEAWGAMRLSFAHVVDHGLEGSSRHSFDFDAFGTEVLNLCQTALLNRGFGEEELLAPLWARWHARLSPAQTTRQVVSAAVTREGDDHLPALLALVEHAAINRTNKTC